MNTTKATRRTPHIVSKWSKEVEVAIPGAKGVIIESITDLEQLKATYQPGEKVVAILSKERMKLGSGWHPTTYTCLKRVAITREEGDEGATTEIRQVHCCSTCGEPVRDREGFYLTQFPKKRLFCTAKDEDDQVYGAPLFEYGGFRRWPLATYIKEHMRYFFQAGIFDESHKFKAKSSDQASAYHKLVDSVRYAINATGTMMGGKSTDLFWLRYRIDPLVRKQYEFNHEIRWAEHFGRLEFTLDVSDSDEDGTFTGQRRHKERAKELPGISPAIYRYLLPSTIFLKIEDLGYTLPPHTETIVPIQMTTEQKLQYKWLDKTLHDHILGCFESYGEGARQEATKLLSVWLQNCLSRPNSGFRPEWVQWKRSGIGETEYEHVAYAVDELPDFQQQAAENEQTESEETNADRFAWLELEHAAIQIRPEEEYEQILAEFERLLRRERTKLEEIECSGSPMALYPVVRPGEMLPKEEWLLNYCLHERSENRKVLVYVRQSGLRDIQPRLAEVLERVGLRTMILPKNVPAKRREKWILDRVKDLDVLICNPMMTETGLDLVQFATCIFYEISYSMYVLFQSMRRLWRLGQTQPVKILFPIYSGTMEEAALSLMGMKMKAMNTLYGDTAASAIADNTGDGNFLSELANRILANEELNADGITSLLGNSTSPSQDEEVWGDFEIDEAGYLAQDGQFSDDSHDVDSQPDTLSNPWERWLAEMDVNWDVEEWQSQKRRKREHTVSDFQLSLF